MAPPPPGNTAALRKQIRFWIVFMMAAIALSGITAFPVETELRWLQPYQQRLPSFVSDWLNRVYTGIHETNARYPFLAYGYDWLAFAHIVIALSFIGPLADPVRNIWIIQWAMVCCILVFPLALIAGPARSVPFFHLVVDCCFGLLGLVPLAIVHKKIRRLELLERTLP